MTQTSPTPTLDGAVKRPSDDPGAEKRKLAMLAAILAGGIVLSLMSGTFPVVAFCLAMVAVVMLHEAAHFVAAKLSGMKATEFFFGFGPRLWSIRKGETEYGIKALPFGGYVKILGMSNLERDIDPADEPRTYRQASYPKRMAVALAGVATHFVLAFLLLVVLLTAIGVPNYDSPSTEVGSLSRLETGAAPALDAGFRVGDRIVAINGNPISSWDELLPYIRTGAGQPLTVVGAELRPGDRAPDFALDHFDGAAMRPVSLGDLAGSVVVLNVVNSVDTPVCDVQTRRVDGLFPTAQVLTVSMDLPFALARWASAAGVTHPAVSSHRSEDFGRAYGVLIKEWRELQRSLFVIDAEGRIAHAEYVADQGTEPDYDPAVAAVTRLAG